MIRSFGIALTLLLAASCGGQALESAAEPAASGGADAAVDSAAPTTPILNDAGAQACNTLDPFEPPSLDVEIETGSPPEPMGGMIQDDVYVLLEADYYGMTPSSLGHVALEVKGTTVNTFAALGADFSRTTATLATTGTTLTLEFTCIDPTADADSGVPAEADYTASGPSLMLFLHPAPGATLVEKFGPFYPMR